MSCTFEDALLVNPIDELTDRNSIEEENQPTIIEKLFNAFNLDFLGIQDYLNLNYTLQLLEEIITSIANAPEINATKVQHFKELIKTGNFEIDSSEIALKILNATEP